VQAKLGWTFGIARGGALFLTALIAFNLGGELLREGFDANGWWIGIGARDSTAASIALAVSGAFLAAWAVRPHAGPLRRALTVGALTALVTLALLDTIASIVLRSQKAVDTSGIPPFSALVALGLTLIMSHVARPHNPDEERPKPTKSSWTAALITTAACVVLFPFAQMICFGRIDHRRAADAAVVFGCRAYADGTPSLALEGRVRTACDLYHQDFVETLVFSGGPGDGDVHETEAMRRFALTLGVPEEAILLDPNGTNTHATVENTRVLAADLGFRRLLAVSHAYHLPRIQLAYERVGLEVYTVPVRETRRLREKPWFLAREVLASWYYFVRPLAESQ
jgi:vancomycin permeability regulator SanA